MRLKMEVWKLTKQVSLLKNKVNKYKWKALRPKVEVSSVVVQIEDVPTTSATTQTDPI